MQQQASRGLTQHDKQQQQLVSTHDRPSDWSGTKAETETGDRPTDLFEFLLELGELLGALLLLALLDLGHVDLVHLPLRRREVLCDSKHTKKGRRYG